LYRFLLYSLAIANASLERLQCEVRLHLQLQQVESIGIACNRFHSRTSAVKFLKIVCTIDHMATSALASKKQIHENKPLRNLITKETTATRNNNAINIEVVHPNITNLNWSPSLLVPSSITTEHKAN